MGIKQVAMELPIYWLNLLLNPTFSSQILAVRRIEERDAVPDVPDHLKRSDN